MCRHSHGCAFLNWFVWMNDSTSISLWFTVMWSVEQFTHYSIWLCVSFSVLIHLLQARSKVLPCNHVHRSWPFGLYFFRAHEHSRGYTYCTCTWLIYTVADKLYACVLFPFFKLQEKAISIWESKGFFIDLDPLPGGVEAVKEMAEMNE